MPSATGTNRACPDTERKAYGRASIAVIVIDCNDSGPVAAFWKAALGYEEAARNGDWVKLRDPAGVGRALAIDRVPEGTVTKNHVHLDLRSSGSDADEVARLVGLRARVLRVFPGNHGVMRDPEGNEFDIVERCTPDTGSAHRVDDRPR